MSAHMNTVFKITKPKLKYSEQTPANRHTLEQILPVVYPALCVIHEEAN